MKDSIRKAHLASVTDRFVRGQMDRRSFLRAAGILGLGAGALGMGFGRRPFYGISQASAQEQELKPSAEITKWLSDVGKPFAGTTLRLATESTPPSNAIATQLKQYFEEATGIKVEIEVLPLEQVLQKLTLDVASSLGTYDLYYIDQSWAASFSQDVFDPREQLKNADLAMPNYNIDDFLKPLVDGIAMYEDRMVGVPYDIPIFIMQYRKDVWDELKLPPPATLDDLLKASAAITDAKGPNMYGTSGQMKSGHYSLECDWTAWLWGHGGSIFGPDGKFTGNDEAGLAAMAYWDKLKKTMPPGVDGWTWDGEGQSVGQGVAASMLSWGEFFPFFDDPKASKVSGLMEAMVPPKPAATLRTVEQTGFGEIPGVGHQGGSSLAVSKYSKSPDAAWIFMQWATSADTQALITVLGGGTGPTRTSVYDDPRVLANARVGAGTTRHLPVVRDTIANYMGSEPDLPAWAELSSDTIPVALGKYFAGQSGSAKESLDALKTQVDDLVAKG
ncbi:ABC transporter substrate-binding protein [Mesorhizobium sp.]|uniref:ABC transporter substrate-binding protein n=1 Tax=Mesorhizobium sp. TaxID=1871066 RepID=UPI000FE61E05|nr:extracellular solute-binding protein [Mesorhizobium sp.]RWI18325.1 MAG: extracellular solute-binding protein [Mesorhizobium sp.]RWK91637.1 MAG: extracellular solute-binding protein [Mesorhizobium sp.]TIP59711.1 MAG: extracellular solute-binding protein [Mesorhizobium sp.]TIQ28009.1 MAG: extracellular solute-binding protein [Mesorhizobium sp.]TIQ94662.1 MAG: extracellular solute-binding protein [Mesorhizobium sp.]